VQRWGKRGVAPFFSGTKSDGRFCEYVAGGSLFSGPKQSPSWRMIETLFLLFLWMLLLPPRGRVVAWLFSGFLRGVAAVGRRRYLSSRQGPIFFFCTYRERLSPSPLGYRLTGRSLLPARSRPGRRRPELPVVFPSQLVSMSSFGAEVASSLSC